MKVASRPAELPISCTTGSRAVGVAVPAALPDELARSIKGRLMRLNGLVRERRTNCLLAEMYRRGTGIRDADVLPIESLAHAVGLDRAGFVCQHTMLPLRRAVTANTFGHAHGADGDPAWRVRSVPQSDRPGAYLCTDCVTEDLEFHGWPYWRRDHQVLGRYWCGKHGTTLRFAETKAAAFLRSPASYLKEARSVDHQWVNRLRKNPAIERYLFLQSELLQRTTPLSKHGVYALLRRLCEESDLDLGLAKQQGSRSLSDLLLEVYGEEWLGTVIRSFERRQPGEALRYINSVNNGVAIPTIAAALAAFYSDQNEALHGLVQAGTNGLPKQQRLLQRCDDEELRRAYIRMRGTHHSVAKELQLNPRTVKRWLDRTGLPTLGGQPLDQLAGELRAFVVDGMSIGEACDGDPGREVQLLRILRGAAQNLLAAVSEMNASARVARRLKAPPSVESG